MTVKEEMEKLQKKFDDFESQIQALTIDRLNQAPKEEAEGPRISQKALSENELYIKPATWIADNQKFNTAFEKEWEHAKEYVQCIPVHNELKGDIIEFWTHPFGGKGAEFWKVPSDKAVWIPRYAAEQLTKCKYHRMVMNQGQITGGDQHGNQYFGSMVAQTTINRIDAVPVSNKRSIFMGAAA